MELDEETGIAARVQASYGITDRLQWQIGTLAFALRLGEPGRVEWVPWGGLDGWGIGYSSIEGMIVTGSLGLGLDTRAWLSGGPNALVLGMSASSGFRWVEEDASPLPNRSYGPDTWRARASVGWTRTLGDTATLAVGAAWSQDVLYQGERPASRAEHGMGLSLGSVLRLGMRPLPLVRLHLSEIVSFDLHASLDWSLANESLGETYMAGWTFTW